MGRIWISLWLPRSSRAWNGGGRVFY